MSRPCTTASVSIASRRRSRRAWRRRSRSPELGEDRRRSAHGPASCGPGDEPVHRIRPGPSRLHLPTDPAPAPRRGARRRPAPSTPGTARGSRPRRRALQQVDHRGPLRAGDLIQVGGRQVAHDASSTSGRLGPRRALISSRTSSVSPGPGSKAADGCASSSDQTGHVVGEHAHVALRVLRARRLQPRGEPGVHLSTQQREGRVQCGVLCSLDEDRVAGEGKDPSRAHGLPHERAQPVGEVSGVPSRPRAGRASACSRSANRSATPTSSASATGSGSRSSPSAALLLRPRHGRSQPSHPAGTEDLDRRVEKPRPLVHHTGRLRL